jgi:DNA (cytosine-5)-methyltransferase 1
MKSGALFAGYGGLDLAVEEVFGATPAWVSEIEPGPSKILAARFPGVPNLGDITKVNWAAVEPVDIITGGSPCQDLSHAGKREGMKAGTRSGLWASMCDAIDIIRPQFVIWENVRGALSATATAGDVETCDLCVGDAGDVHLRALGRVLGDLAELGYDAAWHGLRAADVGAPHGRWRVFVLAWPAGNTADVDGEWRGGPGEPTRLRTPGRTNSAAPDTDSTTGGERGFSATGEAEGGRTWPDAGGSDRAPVALLPTATARDHKGHNQRRDTSSLTGALLPTPRASDGTKGGPNQRGSSGDLMLPSAVTHLLPTPAVNDMGAGKTVEDWDAWTARMKAAHGNGNGHGKSLSLDTQRLAVADLLPTPTATDHKASGASYAATDTHHAGTTLTDATVRQPERFGQYAPAIARWEAILGRPAPAPTEPTGRDGAHRLSPRFVEFLMGLDDGWVTDVGLTRNEQLKALGNGVVPQQAVAALRRLLAIREMARSGVAA